MRTKDEHLLKLIFVCLTDEKHYGDRDGVFLRAPLRTIELIHYTPNGNWRFSAEKN